MSLAAEGQSRRDDLKNCSSSDPDTSVAGCTALIQAGEESGAKLGDAYSRRGEAYVRKGDYDRAILDFNEAIRLNPKLATAYYSRATIYLSNSNYDDAIQGFNDAIRLNPKLANAYGNRATTYCLKGDYSRGIQDFNEEVRLNPKDPLSYKNRAWAYSRNGDYDRAIHDYDTAIRLSLNWTEAYEGRGEVYFFQSNLPAATADFERAMYYAPSSRYYAPTSRAGYDAALLLHVINRQRGDEDNMQMYGPMLALLDLSRWPGPLLRQAMGWMKSDDVMSAAANVSASLHGSITTADLQKQQVCEANYFIGEDALSHNQPATALARFRAARDGCPTYSFGYIESLVELKRIGTPNSPLAK